MLVSNYHFASIFTNSSSNQLKSVIIPWKCPEVALPVTSESAKLDVRKFTIQRSQSCYFVLVYTELFTWYNSNIVLKQNQSEPCLSMGISWLIAVLRARRHTRRRTPQVASVPGGTWSPSRLGRTAGQRSSTSTHTPRPHPWESLLILSV